MKVLLMPSMGCNRSCYYCYLHSAKTKGVCESLQSDDYRTVSEWMAGLEFLERMCGKITSVDISGGEPFLYKNFQDLLKRLIEKYGSVNMTSNLDLMPDSFMNFPYKDRLFITVSYHLNEGGPNIDIMKKMEKLRVNDFKFAVNFVAEENQILLYHKIKEFVRSAFDANTHLEPYIDYNLKHTFFGIPEGEYERSYFYSMISEGERKAIEAAKERGIEQPAKIKCGVANEYMVVVENGDIYPCLGMMFERRNKIGNIFETTNIYLNKSIECDIFCPCAQNYRDGFK